MVERSAQRHAWLLAVVVGGAGCTGLLGGDEGGGELREGASPLCASTPSPGPSPMRRLTRVEVARTVRDLLEVEVSVEAIPRDLGIFGFDNAAEGQSTSPDHVAAYLDLSEAVAAQATANVGDLLPCDATAIDDACVGAFVDAIGRRAWRRPLTGEERGELLGLYDLGAREADSITGVQMVIERLLQSPFFLYRVETEGAGADGVAAVSPHALASRLSYFLWGTMPDAELFEAAASGTLAQPDELEHQARRMLDDPRAATVIDDFHHQWLWLDRLDGLTKSAEVFPDFDPSLLPRMVDETLQFTRQIALHGGDARELFSATHTYLDQELASFYGIDATGLGDELERVDVPETRGGLLTQASVMTALGKPAGTHPILRGKFVREQFFCQELEPPADIPMDDVDDLEAHDRPACAGCHDLLDPIGFSLERYDGLGQYRLEDEEGQPIDASGELVSTDVPEPYEDARGLGERLAQSERVMRCMTRQWFRYAAGRHEDMDIDACSLDTAFLRFQESGWDVRELIVALTLTDAFRFRTTGDQ